MDKIYHPSGQLRFMSAMGLLGCALGIPNAVSRGDLSQIPGLAAVGILSLVLLFLELHKQYRVTDDGIEVKSFRHSVQIAWPNVIRLDTSATRHGIRVYITTYVGTQVQLVIGPFSGEFAYVLISHCRQATASPMLQSMARQYLKWNGLSDPMLASPPVKRKLPQRRVDDSAENDDDIPIAPV